MKNLEEAGARNDGDCSSVMYLPPTSVSLQLVGGATLARVVSRFKMSCDMEISANDNNLATRGVFNCDSGRLLSYRHWFCTTRR
jgi:hypothetical protein